LTAGGNILVLKTLSLTWFHAAESGRNDFIIDLGQLRPAPRKKASNHRKPLRDGLGCRWPQLERRDFTGQAIIMDRLHVFVPDRPDLVREMLFE
jgi:hypothetical protein